MKHYYINNDSQSGWSYDVHCDGCPRPALQENKVSLWDHKNCESAIKTAKKIYIDQSERINGCKHCSPSCHV